MSTEKTLTELVEDAIDKGATTAEEIHRSIAELPIAMAERLGVMEETRNDVKKLQDASIGSVYDLIRDINHKVSKLAGELLEQRKQDSES